jgi:precorrin-4 methylase
VADSNRTDQILAGIPCVAGDGCILGASAEQCETLARSGLAARRPDGGFALTAAGAQRRDGLVTCAGGYPLRLDGGAARLSGG